MKNAICLFIILLISANSARGQLELVAELDFPEKPLLRSSEFDRFRYSIDGDWHIVSCLIAGKRQGRAFNVATGELKSTNYIIENPWIFDSGRINAGWDVSSPNSGWVYLNWNDNGTFVQRPPLQGFPELIEGDKAYGHNWPGLDVHEMEPFAGLSRVLFTIPDYVATNHLAYDLVDQMLYIAHRTGLLVYNLETDSLSTPFDAYIEEHGLEYIPWTGQDGRFLFRPASLENSLEVHEMGHGMVPRIIPQGNSPPNFNPPLWTDNFGYRVSRFHKEKAVSTADSVTWLGYLTNANASPGTTRIIKIDRSLSQPEVDEPVSYLGKVRVDFLASPVVYSLTNEKIVSLGMYGEAGIEPYGLQNGSAVLLKDFYEGPRASVGYAYTQDLNMTGRFQRMAVFNDRVFFPVNASWFGMELALSDGTPNGTRLLADLEPGLKGIRAVEFYPTDTHLYFMVQKDDFSMAIYKLGNELPAEPEIPDPDPNIDWELLLANDDNARNRWLWHNPDIQTAIVLKDSTITYLSDRHDPPMETYGMDILRLSLTQINAHTGAIIKRKLFDGPWLEEDESAQLLARPDGGYTVLRQGRPYYADDQHEEGVEWTYDFSVNYALSMISFDADLNFIELKRLTGNIPDRRYESIIATHAFDEGFVMLVKEQYRDYHLLRFDHDGVFLGQVTIERMNASFEVMEMHIEQETGYLQLINYIRRANCSDCAVRILRYDLNLAFKELWSASYNGNLIHPRLHDTGEGEQWVVGALDGSISLPENSDEKYVSSNGLGKWKIFAARRIKRFNLSQEFITFDVQPLEYYPSFMHDGNIFLHYMRPELGAEVFEYENYIENYFYVPDPLFYEFSQLNSRGEMAAFHELEIEVAIPDKKTFHTSFITSEGKWIRGIRAGSSNVSHVDLWKEPRPSYHVSLANRFQLFQTDWPFTPTNPEIVASVANDEGSHMAIFPNPNSGSFFLVPRDGANQIPYDRMTAYDMQGRLVFERQLQQDFIYKEIQMPASLNEGVYHVVFTGVDVQESLRLVLVK